MSLKKKQKVDFNILNSDQGLAVAKLINYIKDPNDRSVYVLKGWAGTGKTFCVSLMVRYLLEELYATKKWYKVAVTGPTNKAVRVIRKMSGLYHPRVDFQTTHKLLGLKEKITKDGKQLFENDGKFKPNITKVKVVIVDEVSMLSDKLFHDIIAYRGNIKIICMGDPAQIPPIGKIDCIPFREELAEQYGIKTLELKTIMRQKLGHPIIEASTIIRTNLQSVRIPMHPVSKHMENGDGIDFLNIRDGQVRRNIATIFEKHFKTKKFEDDSEYSKIVAWRNTTVDTLNHTIRRIIYGEEKITQRVLKGEKMVLNKPYIVLEDIVLNTNDEFTVESLEILEEEVAAGNVKEKLKYYDAIVWYYDDNDQLAKERVEILHEDSEREFWKLSNIFKQIAIDAEGKNKTWLDYYGFLRRYADVSHAYCITAHKAQGSTYTNAFIMEDDIDMNWKTEEKNRIKYTSYTRASKNLFIIKRF